MEIRYYHLTAGDLITSLGQLLQKSRERGWRVAIAADSSELLKKLDDALWLVPPPSSFLAHGLWRFGDEATRGWAAKQPIILMDGASDEDLTSSNPLIPNQPEVIFALNGFALAPSFYQSQGLTLLCHLFDGQIDDIKNKARNIWQNEKNQGFQPIYYQQSNQGWQQIH